MSFSFACLCFAQAVCPWHDLCMLVCCMQHACTRHGHNSSANMTQSHSTMQCSTAVYAICLLDTHNHAVTSWHMVLLSMLIIIIITIVWYNIICYTDTVPSLLYCLAAWLLLNSFHLITWWMFMSWECCCWSLTCFTVRLMTWWLQCKCCNTCVLYFYILHYLCMWIWMLTALVMLVMLAHVSTASHFRITSWQGHLKPWG